MRVNANAAYLFAEKTRGVSPGVAQNNQPKIALAALMLLDNRSAGLQRELVPHNNARRLPRPKEDPAKNTCRPHPHTDAPRTASHSRYAIALVAAILIGFGAKLFFFSAPTAVAYVPRRDKSDTSEIQRCTSQIFRYINTTTCHSFIPSLINQRRKDL